MWCCAVQCGVVLCGAVDGVLSGLLLWSGEGRGGGGTVLFGAAMWPCGVAHSAVLCCAVCVAQRTVRYCAMWCCAVCCVVLWCGAVGCFGVRCGAVRFGVVRRGAVWCCTVRSFSVRCCEEWCGTVQLGAVRRGAVWPCTVRLYSVRCREVRFGSVRFWFGVLRRCTVVQRSEGHC